MYCRRGYIEYREDWLYILEGLKFLIGGAIILFACHRLDNNKKDVFSVLLIILGILILGFGIGDTTYFANPIFLVGGAILLYKLYIELYVKARNKFYKFDANMDLVTLNREINVEYNPSIVGYLLKNRLELKDLSADIMHLFALKLIDIEKTETGKYNVLLKNKDYGHANISQSDKYILDSLANKLGEFDFKTWEWYVKEDYNSRSFSKIEKVMNEGKVVKNMFLILLIGIVMSIVLFKISFEVSGAVFLCTVILFVFYIVFTFVKDSSKYDDDIYLSEEGKEELKKWLKFKRFISEYTLIKERKVEEIVLYEKYIPYAVVVRYK